MRLLVLAALALLGALFAPAGPFDDRADAQDSGTLLREAIEAVEAGDEERVDQVAATLTDAGDVPPAILEAFVPRDVEVLQIGVVLLDLSDRELYDQAMDVLAREQATLPDRGPEPGDAPDGDRGPRPYEIFILDVEGAATLELLDLRGLNVPESARVPMSMMPGPGNGPGPKPVQFETARREFNDIVGTEYPDDDSNHLVLFLVIAAAGVAGVVAVLAVIRKKRSDQLAELALTDGLTGLRNRRRLDQDLELQRRCEHGTTALLMIDVDHFKAFNDTHGHATGDEVLRLVGAAIESSVREDDITYRYGGEEFCVLLPGTDDRLAADIGDRVRRAIEEIRVAGSPVTASVGVAAGQAREVDAIATSADRALYDAKAAGRNTVVVAESLASNL